MRQITAEFDRLGFEHSAIGLARQLQIRAGISRVEVDVWKKERAYAAGENDKAIFTKLDANKDRQIDKTEASAAEDVLPQFSFADDDSNGKLSETEWMKYRQESAAKAEEKGKETPKAGDMNDDKKY